MYFECPCSYKKELEQEDQIIQHIDHCEQFNNDSPLCNMYKRGNVDEVPIEQLVTFLCDLKLQVERIENVLRRRGYQKKITSFISELNFDHYAKYTSTSKIKSNNGGVKQNGITVKILSNNISNEKQKSSIEQENQNQNQNNKLPPTPPLSPNRFEEERNQDIFTAHQPTMLIEEQPKTNTQQQQQDQKVACEGCRKAFYFNQDFEKLWFLEHCGHVMCKLCIHRLAQEKFVENDGKVLCQEIGCISKITYFELKQILGLDKFNELDKKLALKNQNIVECIKCQSQFSFEKGNPNEQVKDQQGKNISGEALINYANNRFICKQCKTEQCKQCNAVPFHIGMTCQQYKTNQQANKCILCDFPCEGKVCNQEDCQKRIQKLCQKTLDCGHNCNGVKGEECLCLRCSKQEPDDYCNMCFTEALKSAPCIKTECGHIFHEECIMKKLDAKWNGPRIVFQYCTCPLCKKWLDVKHKEIQTKLNAASQLQLQIQDLCIERLDIEGMKQAKEITDPKSQYFQKPKEFAMDKFCFYQCFKCEKPYFGGIKNCQAAAENNDRTQFNKEDLICSSCCPISFEAKCNKHGVKYIEFKCRFCCSVAVWFCGGTTHYCEPCHSGRNPNMNKPCPGPEKCPLGVNHKPTGQENALGCALCRSKRVDDILKKN
ncbi:unnamed protein product [Paramecium primaurelia]|uniref:RING-type domain-containing protein n=1 Tax=Paramecium primaurelia TaxID=5886 RepID=A0A8S1M9P1_PARPR|nr:unnamed protein product [Paramecium primaurelia]